MVFVVIPVGMIRRMFAGPPRRPAAQQVQRPCPQYPPQPYDPQQQSGHQQQQQQQQQAYPAQPPGPRVAPVVYHDPYHWFQHHHRSFYVVLCFGTLALLGLAFLLFAVSTQDAHLMKMSVTNKAGGHVLDAIISDQHLTIKTATRVNHFSLYEAFCGDNAHAHAKDLTKVAGLILAAIVAAALGGIVNFVYLLRHHWPVYRPLITFLKLFFAFALLAKLQTGLTQVNKCQHDQTAGWLAYIKTTDGMRRYGIYDDVHWSLKHTSFHPSWGTVSCQVGAALFFIVLIIDLLMIARYYFANGERQFHAAMAQQSQDQMQQAPTAVVVDAQAVPQQEQPQHQHHQYETGTSMMPDAPSPLFPPPPPPQSQFGPTPPPASQSPVVQGYVVA